MSDIMKSIPFGQLMEWILEEHKKNRTDIWHPEGICCRSGKNS